MKKILTACIVLLFTASVTQLKAQTTSTPGIKKEQKEQQQRIHQGVASGELTKKEAIRLERQQREINRDKKLAKADGVVTPEERAIIKREQRHASKRIYVQKHDAQTR
ncbi:MAG: hypothetical protein U0T74_09805 [Chitinophagales bacterium]